MRNTARQWLAAGRRDLTGACRTAWYGAPVGMERIQHLVNFAANVGTAAV